MTRSAALPTPLTIRECHQLFQGNSYTRQTPDRNGSVSTWVTTTHSMLRTAAGHEVTGYASGTGSLRPPQLALSTSVCTSMPSITYKARAHRPLRAEQLFNYLHKLLNAYPQLHNESVLQFVDTHNLSSCYDKQNLNSYYTSLEIH